jgi:hypothetical protein
VANFRNVNGGYGSSYINMDQVGEICVDGKSLDFYLIGDSLPTVVDFPDHEAAKKYLSKLMETINE